MGEMQRRIRDATRPRNLVSGTHRHGRDKEDVRRTAHNPEVAGSNPAPATKEVQIKGLIASHGGRALIILAAG